MLETCLAEVISEIAELLSTRKRLEERGGKVASKIGVNASRLQVPWILLELHTSRKGEKARNSLHARIFGPLTAPPASVHFATSSNIR